MAKILVADDAPAVLDVLREILVQGGHEVVAATSGAEAVRKFHESRPALAVLDIIMPDMDGLLVLDSIRRVSDDVPVIMITGSLDGEAVAKRLTRYPAVSFFAKGSGLDCFVELVNKTLGMPGRAGS
jgi:CheY-like chemotaxis protein